MWFRAPWLQFTAPTVNLTRMGKSLMALLTTLHPLLEACFSLSLDEASFFFFFSLAERAITAVPVTALQKEAIVTSSAMPRFHQAETKNKGTQHKKQPSKTNNTTPTKHKPKTKHLSGNRAAYSCTTYN